MTFPILGGNGAVGGYAIDNSLRFNDDDNAYLSKTLSASPTNQKIVSFSFWAKRGNLGIYSYNLVGNTSAPYVVIGFLNDDTFSFQLNAGSGSTGLITTAKYRDTSAWYHMLCVLDTTQATSSNRLKIYINGIQITDFGTANYPAQDSTWNINTNVEHGIGGSSAIQDFDGYMAEVHFIDGTAKSPTDFGEFDEDSGIWKPIQYTGTYGTNGFYLDFENSGSLGADQSGNGNNFTPANLASTDQTTDTPTNNFCTMNPLEYTGATYGTGTLSEGNCKVTIGDNNTNVASFTLNQGKWYWEQKHISSASSQNRIEFGIIQQDVPDYIGGDSTPNQSGKGLVWGGFGDLRGYISTSSFGTFAPNDIIGCALDMDAQTLQFYKNGSAVSTAQDFSGAGWTNVAPTIFCSNNAGNEVGEINFGNPSFTISSGNSDDNGYGNFEYAPPSGYLALCTQNLATELSPTIDDASAHFQVKLYSGNNTETAITYDGNSNLQPDFIWAKSRSNAHYHDWRDTSRGLTKRLYSNDSGAEDIKSASYVSFDSNGFTLGDDIQSGSPANTVNSSGNNYASWGWRAGGGTTSSNTDGSITSTVQANTTAGFSIVTYTGNSIAGATVGHGLGKVPAMFIIKNRGQSNNWPVYHQANTSAPETELIKLDQTFATSDSTLPFNDTAPTSTVFSVSNWDGVNSSSYNYVAYCFAEIEGYSKMGSYTGNGSTDGPMITTMFRPAMILLKRTDSTASWFLYDNKRDSYNEANASGLYPNLSNAEFSGTSNVWDFTSNGFKGRASTSDTNASGGTYIYMAFAENPFVSSTGIPVTAR